MALHEGHVVLFDDGNLDTDGPHRIAIADLCEADAEDLANVLAILVIFGQEVLNVLVLSQWKLREGKDGTVELEGVHLNGAVALVFRGEG